MSDRQTVLVTGGASGIGLAIVEAVLAEGWRAIVADLDQASLDRCRDVLGASDRQVRFERMNVADEEAVIRADRGLRERVRADHGSRQLRGYRARCAGARNQRRPVPQNAGGQPDRQLRGLAGGSQAHAARAAAVRSSTSPPSPGSRATRDVSPTAHRRAACSP